MEQECEFTLGQMLGIGLTLVVLGIALSYGLEVMSDVKSDVSDANATTAISDGIEGVAKLPNKMPLIATVVVAAIVIGILLRYFAFAR